MKNVQELMKKIDEIAPFSRQEPWDNSGLLVGRIDMPANRILLCLDIDESIMNQAIEGKYDVIISHHPIIFKGVSKINNETLVEKIVWLAIKNDIAIIACHTNFDFADEGMNDYIAHQIKADEIEGYIKSDNDYFIGRIARFKEAIDTMELLNRLKSNLSLSFVRYTGSLKNSVSSVLITTGAFDSDMTPIDSKIYDMIITGDTKYHTVKDIEEEGVHVIDIGHFGSEICFGKVFNKQLSKVLNDVTIDEANSEKDVYNII